MTRAFVGRDGWMKILNPSLKKKKSESFLSQGSVRRSNFQRRAETNKTELGDAGGEIHKSPFAIRRKRGSLKGEHMVLPSILPLFFQGIVLLCGILKEGKKLCPDFRVSYLCVAF